MILKVVSFLAKERYSSYPYLCLMLCIHFISAFILLIVYSDDRHWEVDFNVDRYILMFKSTLEARLSS